MKVGAKTQYQLELDTAEARALIQILGEWIGQDTADGRKHDPATRSVAADLEGQLDQTMDAAIREWPC